MGSDAKHTQYVSNWPVYHRLETPTQTSDEAKLQEQSQEIWGKVPRYGVHPAVQAYDGPLPKGKRGIEFRTDVPPDSTAHPSRREWRGPRLGVRVEGDFAKIRVVVTKNTQS